MLATGGRAFAQTNTLEILSDGIGGAGAAPPVVTGAERMDAWLPLLADKRVGLVVNHSSVVGKRHLVDTLCSLGHCVSRIFAPEHGFRGSAPDGEEIRDGQDARTGIPVISLRKSATLLVIPPDCNILLCLPYRLNNLCAYSCPREVCRYHFFVTLAQRELYQRFPP